ncbi:MAG: YitT family protein, partial [Sporomusaceae bacterium]|nr:YitT family protein [Sporomusaceae bacterium]
MTKEVLRRKIRQYATVGLGCTISAVGINTFYVSNQLFSGGISGIAMFSYFLYEWPIGLVAFILNVPLFLAAYKFLSLEYTIGAVYGMTVFSIVIDSTSFLAGYKIIDDTFLAAIYGGIVGGL